MNFNGIFLGSGAARTIGLGFVPQRVLLRNLTSGATLLWDRNFGRATALGEGEVTDRSTDVSVPATWESNFDVANAEFWLRAKEPGQAGNAITIALVDPAENNQALEVTNDGNAITVSLKTGSGGDIESTAAEVVAAINAADGQGEAGTLVEAYVSLGNNGTGVVTAEAATPLTGGADGKLSVLLTAGQGIRGYEDGAAVTSAGVAALMPTSMVPDYAGDMRTKGAGAKVNLWTLTNSGNRTGKFNAAIDTDLVKAGSVIQIEGKTYFIQSITSTGAADDQVTLNQAAPTGRIEKILYPYDLAPIPAGTRIPRGFYLAETATVNKNNELVQIQAEG